MHEVQFLVLGKPCKTDNKKVASLEAELQFVNQFNNTNNFPRLFINTLKNKTLKPLGDFNQARCYS